MTKLKAESDLQQSRLMEYQVASEHQEQQKTRLEEEVKELVKRVQEMEGVRQKKDLDAASKVSELEGKVRALLYGAMFMYFCTNASTSAGINRSEIKPDLCAGHYQQ